MREFKYSLGQAVLLDPFGNHYAAKGIVIGRIEWIDNGSPAYFVSAQNPIGGEILRHLVAECEISPLPAEPSQVEMAPIAMQDPYAEIPGDGLHKSV